jgi:cytochrome c2
LGGLGLLGVLPASAFEVPPIDRAQLVAANYRQGMLAFQQRCSACHSLADGGTDLIGPNLYGVFKRRAGEKADFVFSAAMKKAAFPWDVARMYDLIGNPKGLPGSTMLLPEPVPEADRVALISYMMVETGAADWPRPPMPRAATNVAANAPLAERFPTFWNHLMTNTARYKLTHAGQETRFDIYFNTNGTVTGSSPQLRGFWRETPGEMFCYALQGIPSEPKQLIECFPIVAMSIPRFRDELWTSEPAPGVKLTGGIVAGRPMGGPQ